MSNKIEGMNILVCGSQKFEDQTFVCQVLEQFYSSTNGNVRKLFTSKFSGACEHAKNWMLHKNDFLLPDKRIQLAEFVFDGFLKQKNIALYDNLEIPDIALQNSSFFQQGKDLLIAKGINLVLAFPNREGILGASTRNVTRFAKLANIQTFDCSDLLANINAYRESQVVNSEHTNSTGFTNRHPNKK